MRNRVSDPIVDEVRRVRAELAARYGNDVAAIIRHAQTLERPSDRTFVRYPARHVVPAGVKDDQQLVAPKQVWSSGEGGQARGIETTKEAE